MGFKSSNDLEFGMAVINVLPSDGKVIDEGPVGCSVDVCCDDFRHLDIGLPPEILRLKDAGYLTQAVAACDRLLIIGRINIIVESREVKLTSNGAYRFTLIDAVYKVALPVILDRTIQNKIPI